MQSSCNTSATIEARDVSLAKVSIILPTYNRANFLPEALQAIKDQQWTDWELIVVDDGSTDNTRDLIPELTRDWPQQVRYIHQENQGPYGARNTGLDHATGEYVAFYDSDDLWLPHHLKNCVQSLDTNTEVDWVFAACRLVEYGTRKVLSPNSFQLNGNPKPIFHLAARQSGALHIIEDQDVIPCAILHGHCAGLQNSVMRRTVFEHRRFESLSRNEAEDQLVVVRYLKSGSVLAYLDAIHVIYHVHAGNASAASGNLSSERLEKVVLPLIDGFRKLGSELDLSSPERKALRQRLAREYFWSLGFNVYWRQGRPMKAIRSYLTGLCEWPWNFAYWKTFFATIVKLVLLRTAN